MRPLPPWAGWLLVSGAGLGLAACNRTTQAHAELASKAASDPIVAVARVSPAALSREVRLSGEFRPYQAVDLHAKVAGYLREIRVDVGSRVQAGQLLAVLEVPEMRDDVAQATATSRRSTAEVARARQDLERAQAALRIAVLSSDRLAAVSKKEPGLIAQQELDEALSRRQSAEAQVAAAKANLDAAQDQVDAAHAGEQRARTMTDYSRITAPFSGVITKRYADTGAMIQAGTASQSQAMPLVRITQIDRLRLVLPVPESLVPQLKPGRPVEVRVPSLNRTLTGTVARSSNDVQLATRTMDVEVDVPNPAGELVPGMVADVTLTLAQNNSALAIPTQAMTTRGDKRYVLLVEKSGVLQERAVETGMEAGSKIEVRQGLAAGDLVVIGNRSQLQPGQRVEPKLSEVG